MALAFKLAMRFRTTISLTSVDLSTAALLAIDFFNFFSGGFRSIVTDSCSESLSLLLLLLLLLSFSSFRFDLTALLALLLLGAVFFNFFAMGLFVSFLLVVVFVFLADEINFFGNIFFFTFVLVGFCCKKYVFPKM